MTWPTRARALLAEHPILAAVVVGAALRLVAVLTGYGPFAADDYGHGIEMAWRWCDDPSLPFSSAIRSPLFARILWGLMTGARALGLEDPAVVLQACYAVLGALSLAAIPGIYRLAVVRLGREAAITAALLMATFALMPRISTRPLLGVVAMVPLVWGLVAAQSALLTSTTRSAAAAGFAAALLLGAAALVRFQLGIVAVAVVGWLAWRAWRERSLTHLAVVGAMALGGAIVMLAQGALDASEGRTFFGTLIAYVDHNRSVSSRFGVSPPYTYVLWFLAMTAPPATIALIRPMVRGAALLPLVTVPFVAFVTLHSLIPHKEDRFMFPMLPLLFVLLAYGLAQARKRGPWARRAVIWFWAANSLGLVIATFSDGGRAKTTPYLTIAREHPTANVAVIGRSRVMYYYLGDAAEARHFRRASDLQDALSRDPWRPDFVLFSGRSDVETDLLEKAGLHCAPVVEYAGDFADRAMILLNPEHNKRRLPTYLARCQTRAGRGPTNESHSSPP